MNSPIIFRLANVVKDCGLCPDYVPPNYCLQLTYPPGTAFGGGGSHGAHFDSRHRWGEVIVGVTLGQAGEMILLPPKNMQGQLAEDETTENNDGIEMSCNGKSVRISLPRRSIYVLSGSSRYDWKHGIIKQKPKKPPPSWNPNNLRRSLTLRSTKAFSHVYIGKRIREDPTNQDLRARLAALRRFKIQHNYNDKPLSENYPNVEAEKARMEVLLAQMDSGLLPVHERFQPTELTFQLPAHALRDAPVAVATSAGGEMVSEFAEYGGIDPSMDPELAMALRVSMEEERARQERMAAQQFSEQSDGGTKDRKMCDDSGAAAAIQGEARSLGSQGTTDKNVGPDETNDNIDSNAADIRCRRDAFLQRLETGGGSGVGGENNSSVANDNRQDTVANEDEDEDYRNAVKDSLLTSVIKIDEKRTSSSRGGAKYDDDEGGLKPRAARPKKKKRMKKITAPEASVPRNDPEVFSLLDED